MTRAQRIEYVLVDQIPRQMREATLYISLRFATAIHLCCCGCGTQITTPLRPTDWRLTFDGESVSLHPSVGNSGLACQSHYWIERCRVRWAPPLSRAEIDAARDADRDAKAAYFGGSSSNPDEQRSGDRPQWWVHVPWLRRLVSLGGALRRRRRRQPNSVD